MKDKEKQIEEMVKDLEDCIIYSPKRNEYNDYILDYNTIVKRLVEKGWVNPTEDSVVFSREEYERLKKYEYKVQCGVCFTQKEWFDFINEESNRRTSLLIEAKEQGYEQAHKEMLKDCIESNKIAEQIGYEKGSKETTEKIIDLIKTFCPDKKLVEVITRIISERLGVETKEGDL